MLSAIEHSVTSTTRWLLLAHEVHHAGSRAGIGLRDHVSGIPMRDDLYAGSFAHAAQFFAGEAHALAGALPGDDLHLLCEAT